MEHGGPDFDYSVFVAALGIMSVAIVFTFYHCIVVTWCNHRNGDRPVGLHAEDLPMRSVEISTVRLIPPAHAYRKGEGTVGGGKEESVCAVCLCEFKDEEQVRELPECKHLFHVPCIDMWLYSHSSCPMCRTETPRHPQQYPETQRPSDGLLEFGG